MAEVAGAVFGGISAAFQVVSTLKDLTMNVSGAREATVSISNYTKFPLQFNDYNDEHGKTSQVPQNIPAGGRQILKMVSEGLWTGCSASFIWDLQSQQAQPMRQVGIYAAVPFSEKAYLGLGTYQPEECKSAEDLADKLWALSWDGTDTAQNIKKGVQKKTVVVKSGVVNVAGTIPESNHAEVNIIIYPSKGSDLFEPIIEQVKKDFPYVNTISTEDLWKTILGGKPSYQK